MNGEDRERGAMLARMEHVEGEIEKLRAWKHTHANTEQLIRSLEALYHGIEDRTDRLEGVAERVLNDRETVRWSLLRTLLPWFVAAFAGGGSLALWIVGRH